LRSIHIISMRMRWVMEDYLARRTGPARQGVGVDDMRSAIYTDTEIRRALQRVKHKLQLKEELDKIDQRAKAISEQLRLK